MKKYFTKKISMFGGKRGLAVFIILIILLLFLAAFFYIRTSIDSVKRKKGNELVLITELKKNGIAEWYADELNDAAVISGSTFLINALRSAGISGEESGREELLSYLKDLRTEHGYSEIILTNHEGSFIASSNDVFFETDTLLTDFIKQSVEENRVVCTDLYLNPTLNEPRIDFIAPVHWQNKEKQSVIILRLDPKDYLYPFLSFRTSSDNSSESVLFREHDGQFLVLSELRHESGVELKKQLPFPSGFKPKAQMPLIPKGIFEVKDYRGVDVLSYVSPVDGTTWGLITKIDKAEVFKDLKTEITLVSLLFILLLLFLGLAFWLFNVERQRRILASLLHARDEFKTTVYSIGDGVIITDKTGLVKNINPVAEALTGWNETDALNRNISEVFRLMNEETDAEVVNPVNKVLSDKAITRLASHSLLVSKTGKKIPVSENAAPIKNNSGQVTGAVLVFHDQTQQRNYQAALESSEERYRRMFVDNPQPMWIYDLETLHFLEVNKAAINKYGYTRDEFLKMTIKDIRPDFEVKRLLHDVVTTNQVLNHAGEWIHTKKNGEFINVVIVSHLVIYNGKKARHVMVNDVTERVIAESALQKSEEKFRNLFENHSAVKLIIDALTGQIVDANASAVLYYGWSHAELTSMNISQINTLPEEQLKEEMEKVMAMQRTHFEFCHRHKNGSLSDVEVFSSKITVSGKEYLHSIIHDVTGKKYAEQRVNLLIRSIEQSPVGIIITNPQGIIEYVNPKLVQMSGFASDELIGQVPDILNPAKSGKTVAGEAWSAIRQGKEWRGECPKRRKNGELFWENALISPVFDKTGEISHYVIINEDITAQKRMINELKSAKERAEESDRLKSAFLANMSHEIRTPMNGILGFMDLLLLSELENEMRDEYIGIVKSSGERLLNTINDIIDISRVEAGQTILNYSSVNVNELMNKLYRFFKFEAEKKGLELTVHGSLSENLALIKTDQVKLESILTNLIKNAIKFTRQGNVTISFGVTADSMLEFRVADTGKGIPSGKLNSIFERFVQADVSYSREYEGSGLGLSISKAYAEMMDGNINVVSEVSKGSEFVLTLPFVTSEEDVEPERPVSFQLDGLPNDNVILVAEDDDVSFYYLKKIMADSPVKLVRALNGEEAVLYCRKNPGISLVLMDIKMPVMDGLEATRQIFRMRKELPVIALTAYAFEEDKRKALASGCVDYLSKPIKRDLFLSVIDKYILSKNNGS